jgi:hypothetical protein
MIFAVVILLALAAIVFFHWIQGFFSGVISAIVAIVSAVVALSFHETLLEGPLAGMSPNWMPTLVLLGLFALSYIILRTIFDKIIPGGIMLPALADRIGGAVMGLVAGCFGLGIVVIAAQLMPFGSSIGGYTRYQVKSERIVTVPGNPGSGSRGNARTGAFFDEVDTDQFDDSKRSKLLVPVDDVVVDTVAHLSDKGALSADKPFHSIHPDYLQEIFGQRLGIQVSAARSILNSASKGQTAVEVIGVYTAPAFSPAQIVDHEFTKMRETPLKISAVGSDRRVVVRLKFNSTPEPDRMLRLGPAAVRLVAPRPSETSDELVPRNHYPIGTIEPNGLLYANKIDDFLFIDVPAKKVDGSEGPAEVDFVFQVSDKGFLDGDPKSPDVKIAEGTFVEVKRFGRVDLSGKDLKPSMPRVSSLAVRRKRLDWAGGPAPMVPGKAGAGTTAAPPAAGGGGGELGQRLVGTWENRGLPGKPTVTYTFTADGGLSAQEGSQAQEMRWVAVGPPQGETLTIKFAPTGTDPASGNTFTISFVDADTFNGTDSSGGSRRFVRSGGASAQPAPPQAIAPNEAISRMSGTWESATGLSYAFRPDGTYTAAQAAQPGVEAKSASGNWKILSTEGTSLLNVELVKVPGGTPAVQKWDIAESAAGQILRVDTKPAATVFKRKS